VSGDGFETFERGRRIERESLKAYLAAGKRASRRARYSRRRVLARSH
jgi:hypothetical protein